jgi:hypothetical protein
MRYTPPAARGRDARWLLPADTAFLLETHLESAIAAGELTCETISDTQPVPARNNNNG